MKFIECRYIGVVSNLIFFYLEDYQEMLKRFERLELDGNSKKVFQLKDMAKNFAKTVFPGW